ncbi:HTTM domain-containing protein [Planctomicrobium sp. SH664]|uniref:HTTM domain-containing protein n=1 Tax=Planctomicrobium sp. SH664 TaxID=3448125 RepID=UPI003F5B0AB6
MTDSTMKQRIRRDLQRVENWFYAPEVPYALALMRILVPFGLMFGVLPRWFHARELYSTDGIPAPFWEGYGHTDLLPILPGWGAVALYTLFVFVLTSAMLGWKTRFCLAMSALLYPYFGLLDALGTMAKFTIAGTHFLFLLTLSDCGKVWSIDAWLRGPVPESELRSPRWPRRLVQMLLGLIYLGAAATKLHTPSYFNGDQLSYWLLTNVNMANPLGEFLTLFPALIVVMCYVTLLWEATFLFLAWRGWSRVIMISLGIVFHLMTMFTLGLVVFPLIFIATYSTFLSEREARGIGEWVAGRGRALQKLTGRLADATTAPGSTARGGWLGVLGTIPGFAAVLVVVSSLGVAAEATRDPFRERGPQGKMQLPALSDERAAELLRNDVAVSPRDKVFSYDVGTTLVGGVLADRCSKFKYGEIVRIQCRLVQPHEDIWVEVNLHDANNRVIERLGDVVPREQARATFYYTMLEAFEPGDYDLVLRCDNQELQRKRITLSR